MALSTGCSFFAACFHTSVGVLGRLGPVGARARFMIPLPSLSLGAERFDIAVAIAGFK
jgi:hypothetical protein